MHAIINKIPTNWVEVFKNHMRLVAFKCSYYLPYAIFISRVLLVQGVRVIREKKSCCDNSNKINQDSLISLGMKKILIGWYFKDETMFSPKAKFEIFTAEQFKALHDKIDDLRATRHHEKDYNSPEEYTTKIFDSD